MNQLVISLLAMSIELSFVPAARAREGEVGGFWAEIASWLFLGLAVYRKPLVGTGRAISILHCTNGLRKQSSGRVGLPFYM